MRKNENFKRLMIFAIAATMCLFALPLLPTASADCPDDCPSGMISYWKLDETSSGPVVDCYGSNDGVNNGATINQPGKVGTAYDFDGIGDYTECPETPSLKPQYITLAAWIKPTTAQNHDNIVSKAYAESGGGGRYYSYGLKIHGNGKIAFVADIQLTNKAITTTATINFNQWYFITGTWDGTHIRLYINGAEQECTGDTAMYCEGVGYGSWTYGVNIGRYSAGSSFFEGKIDEVAIYNQALSADEILDNYFAGIAGYGYCDCPDTVYVDDDYTCYSPACSLNMLSYWHLDETTAGPVIDWYGSYDGTNNGATINQPGHVETAYNFGSGDYINCGDITELNSASAFTVLGWYKDDNIMGHNRHFDKGNGWDDDISGTTYSGKLYIEVGNGANTYASWSGYSSEISSGEWYFAAFIFNGSGATNADKAKIYVNGIQRSLNFGGGNMPTTTADLTGDPFTLSKISSDQWDGDMDEIAVFDRALSSSEISNLYYNSLPGYSYCLVSGWQYDHFDKIQDGVDAVCSSTVYVAAGTYVEQINVDKSVTMIGAGMGTTIIQSPDTLTDYFTTSNSNYPILYIHDIDDVTIQDLTVDGAGKGNANYRFVGIGIYQAGATVSNVELINVRDTPFSGAQHGVAIYGWSDATGTPHDIFIEDCEVYDYQKTGIALGGSDLTVDISGCTVTGTGPTTVTAQNGIQVSHDAIGSITENTVSDCSYTGPNWAASGILPYMSGGILEIDDNILEENQANIYLCACSADIDGNEITASATGTGQTYFYGIIGDPGNPPIIPDASPTDEGTPPVNKVTYTMLVTNNDVEGDGSSGGVGIGVYAGMYGSYDIDFTAMYNNVFDWGVGFELYEYAPNELITADINYNNIVGNDYGVYNWLTTKYDATCNWWGDISGPSGVGPGIGDSVSSNVKYCPWLDDVYPNGNCIGGAVCWNTDTGEYFCSIQKAIDDSDTDNGDTIEVFTGTHPGNIIVYKEVNIESQSGAASTIIDASVVDYSTYQNAWGKGINYAWAETNDPGLLKNGFMIWSDYVTIDGFTIINAAWPSQYNRGIGILIGSIHTTYAGFIPWNIDQWGGIIPSPDEPTPTGIVIKNNIIDGASDGIYNWASNGNTFEYNTVMNSIALGGVGIQCYEGGTNNIIHHNTIDNVDGSGISICGAWPDVLLDVSNTQIYNNLVTNSNYGVQFYNIDGSNVDAYNNNILSNNIGVVVEGAGGALVGHANYNNIMGNTIGVQNTAPDGDFDATCNYYGHAFGPIHPSNPLGIGNPVSNNVVFIPWLNLPFEDPNTICGGGLCYDPVYVDDDYKTSTPGYGIDHFPLLQWGLYYVCPGGTVYVYPGIYLEAFDYTASVNGITIIGVNIPLSFDVNSGNSAILEKPLHILGDDITVNNLVFNPSSTGAVIVSGDNIIVQYNKFIRGCLSDPIGIENQGQSILEVRYNWWGRPDGPSGNTLDANTGRKADGLGVKIVNNGPVLFDPWAGIDAVAEASATVVEIGETIIFDSKDSFACHLDGSSNDFDVFWDFDDGLYSFEKQIAHVYDSPGTYEVSLRIKSQDPQLWGEFMYDWDYITIIVTTPGAPLTANADGNNLGGYETIVDESIQLYGLAVGGTEPYTYSWDLGDGTTNNKQNPTHIYDKAGTYIATLTVTDSLGATDIDTAEVTVYDVDELLVNIVVDKNTVTGIENIFTASVTGGTQPYTYNWDFGDGITSTDHNPTHIYEETGTYAVTLTVTDNDNNKVSDSATITVEEGESDIEPAEIKKVTGGFGIKATIAAGNTDCDWTINVDGSFVLLGGEASGTIQSNNEETVKLPLTFALGKVNVKVTANEIQKEYTAFAIGPFYLNIKEV